MDELTDEAKAAYAKVRELVMRADGIDGSGSPMWFGWALREAFMAGAKWQRENGEK